MLTPDLYQTRAYSLAFRLCGKDLSASIYQESHLGLNPRQALAKFAREQRSRQRAVRESQLQYPEVECGYCGQRYRHSPRTKPICNACGVWS